MIRRPDEYDFVANLAQNREIGRQGLNGNERHVEFSAPESLENMATAAGLQREFDIWIPLTVEPEDGRQERVRRGNGRPDPQFAPHALREVARQTRQGLRFAHEGF